MPVVKINAENNIEWDADEDKQGEKAPRGAAAPGPAPIVWHTQLPVKLSNDFTIFRIWLSHSYLTFQFHTLDLLNKM